MELNQTTLRSILAQVLSVNEKYIVPKQGNWWNPQENQQNIKNWCAYQIRSNKPRTAPFYHESNNQNRVVVEKIADIALQFVGPDSETIAESVAAWPLRGDVKAALQQVQGAIMYDDMTAVASTFFQDGNNTVMAWNVNIKVLWYSVLNTSQGLMPCVNLKGKINT